MEKSYLKWKNKLLFEVKNVEVQDNIYVYSKDNNKFKLLKLSKDEYLIYLDISRSKKILTPIYEFKEDDYFYLVILETFNKSEDEVKLINLIENLSNIFDLYSFEIELKKEHIKTLSNLYKVLDNKFSYLEMRIREIEISPYKNDISWIVLSKYYNVLDAKMYMYDLQQDIFKMIDNKVSIKMGLVNDYPNINNIKNALLEPLFDVYYAPKSMMYARIYLNYDYMNNSDKIKERVDLLSDFDKKYFVFMVLYVLILNIRFSHFIDYKNIGSYLEICKKINIVIKKYRNYLE